MKKTFRYILILFLGVITLDCIAGPFDGGGECPPGCMGVYPNCDPCDDPAIPLDGGVSLLIAAGVGLAGKKAYDFRKNKKAEKQD